MERREIGPGLGRARPRLILPDRRATEPRGVVLMLHGGDVEGVEARSTFDPSPLPVRVAAAGIARRRPDLAVVRLLNAVGGWNDRVMSPVADAQWALMRIGQLYPDLPVAVVGHSMGGRTAFELVDEADVRAVIGLAPWLADGYDEKRFLGTPVMVVHGRLDNVTDPDASADLVRRIRIGGGSATYRSVGDWHTLMFRPAGWHREVASFLHHYLVGDGGDQPRNA
ncbi:lysophospholipase [Yimella sp. NH-Cas1]|uniref:alpha/beta hydrolase n=1 Tax=Yimella sp. NH-Cas1 TaxID=2917726 RepID=UPI001EFBFD90|nr:lysophospholipase [Yimella sp. NH-Cas1]MCG8656525.1 lysophospholipase [Yimella sp. NH-Cas1]